MRKTALLRLLNTTAKTAKVNSPAETGKILRNWSVMRIDTHGNTFKMKTGMTQEEAEKIADEYEAKGHHQGYWAIPDYP